MAGQKQVGVIGSRALPKQYQQKVSEVVKYLISHGHTVCHGGALGADHFVLKALLEVNSSNKSILFSAWQNMECFPFEIKPDVQKFIESGGRLFWGAGPKKASYATARASLLARNCELVTNCDGLVAFVYGESRGTWFTIREAVKKKIPVIIFLCKDNLDPPDLSGIKWCKLTSNSLWSGAFKSEALAYAR
jgi:predicted Rossmann fold nucleotide-binding protein DprA/Smf involved in DNA uptake